MSESLPKKHLSQQGFTLMELLITIAIIGIIATLTIIAINPQKRFASARDAERKAGLRQIATNLALYDLDHGVYPSPCGRYSADSCDSYNDEEEWVPDLKSQSYVKTMPIDPINNGFVSVYGDHLSYFYISEDYNGAEPGEHFILGTWLEDTGDPETLDNLGNGSERPHWPNCSDEVLFSGNIYIIRSFNCPNDPPGSL